MFDRIDAVEQISILKDLFAELCLSRRQLKPILTEILRAIDNNVFVDADSEDVKKLLEQILLLQDRLSKTDCLKQAAATKKLAVVDEAINELDRKQTIKSVKIVLNRFKDLVCNSNDENELDAAKKLKKQAHKLFLKAEKMDPDSFATEGKKFIDIIEVIENPDKISSTSFLEIQDNFSDNKFLVYTIMKHSLQFASESESDVVINTNPTISEEDTPIVTPAKPAKQNFRESIEAKKFDIIKKVIKEYKASVNSVLLNEEDLTIEKKIVKKRLTVKSLNNKLHEFVDGSESVLFPVLRTFYKCRIFSTDSTFAEDQEFKSRSLVPIIVEKLFNWSIADKVHWLNMTFYYLNDSGQELLSRILSIKDIKSTVKSSNDSSKKQVAIYLRRFILFSTIWALKIKKNNNKLDGDTDRFWIRSTVNMPNNTVQTFFVFSIMFFDENWFRHIDSFIKAFLDEREAGSDIKGVILASCLSEDLLESWVKVFDRLGIKNIYKFLIVKDACILIDESGNRILPSDWADWVSFGIVGNSEEDENIIDVNVNTSSTEDVSDNQYNNQNDKGNTYHTENDISDDSNDAMELLSAGTKTISTNNNIKLNFEDSQLTQSSSKKYEYNPPSEKEDNIPSNKAHILDDSVGFINSSANDTEVLENLLLNITKFFISGSTSRGMLFLHIIKEHALSKNEDWALNLSLEVGYILDDPIAMSQLGNYDPFDFWDTYFSIPNVKVDDLCDYLNLAAIIKSFFAPPEPMSFQLRSRWNQINDDRSNIALKSYPSTKKLINLFRTFSEQTHESFASCLNVDHSHTESELTNAIEAIKTVRDRADAIVRTQIKHPRSKGLVKLLYEPEGVVRRLLSLDDNKDSIKNILDFCNDFMDGDIKKIENPSIYIDENIFSAKKIGDYLDDTWSSIKVDSHKNEKFTGVERVRQIKIFTQALVALLSYAVAKKRMNTIKKSGKHSAPVTKALEILNDIVEEFSNLHQPITVNFIGPAVFIIFIENLAAKINGIEMPIFYRDCLLGPRYLELTNDGIPTVESYGVSGFSFENCVLDFEESVNNLTPKEAVNSAYETAVRSCDLGILKLLEINFREMLDRSDEELKRRRENVSKQVDRQLDRIYHEFLDNLELDRNYDRITDQEEIDRYIAIATEAKEHFAGTKNVGIFQRFINACNADIVKAAMPHKNAMEQRLNTLTEKLESKLAADEKLDEKYPIISEIHRQLNLGNLTVAEDYMNRWDENNGHFSSLNIIESHNDAFDNFLKDYESIFNACVKNKSESLEKIHSRMRGGTAKNRSERDAADFVSAWQGLNTDLKSRAETSIIELLKHFSFTAVVDKSEKIPPNQWNFHVSFPEYRRSKAAYPHPFAVYGTDIAHKGLTIVYLASNRTADNIIETLAVGVKSDCGVICVVDFALSLAERRKLAQAFKLRPDLKDIIVIDRVMAIYLTRFEDSVRGVNMLKTALPFARVQPYTTGGVVAPEMFIGRSKELAKIRDMAGPVFVYGGRQLGKSALLRQVRNIENDPENGDFAFFIELKGLDSDKSLEKIVRELKEAGLINANKSIDNWDDFSFAIKDLMNGKSTNNNAASNGKSVNKLMLLLDESDDFLASVENSANRAIDVLRELRETFSGSFKFVLAGLHKVIRFEKNSSFGNLDHISVLPFSPTDALELLIKPMSCLGFVIEDEGLTSAIFSKANYYPGLIQYYCKMIVDAAGDNYLQRNFDVTKNPPYKLDDEYLKNMLGKRDFQDEINKKFQITLKLDDDNYYEVIALVIALEYYEHNRPVHVSIDKIRETCFIYDIDKIADMSDAELENLLSEMVELNLLRKVEDQYEFNRYAFWHMMGTESEVNTRLTTINKQ